MAMTSANERRILSKQRSVRLRVFFIFIVASAFIIVLGLGLGGMYVLKSMDEAIEIDFVTNTNLCDDLVSLEMSLLKQDVNTVAQRIERAPKDSITAILEDELSHSGIFMGMTVLNHEAALNSAGEYPTSNSLLSEPYLLRVFGGMTVISTTRMESDGVLTMHVCAPIDENRVLSVTIDGLYFQYVLEHSRIWKSGYVFLIDDTGTLIACTNVEWVKERRNVVDVSVDNQLFDYVEKAIGSVDTHATTQTLVIQGDDDIIAYRTVTLSVLGWVIGTTAPLAESPTGYLFQGLLVTGIVCFVCAIFGALLTAIVIGSPYREAERHKLEAIEANEAKSLFLANMSHEMRTPLNAIIGLTELALTTEDLSKEVRPLAENVYNSGVTLLGLVNDILDHSKVQAGKLEIIPVDYDTPSLINDTVVLNVVRIGSKPIELKLDIAADLPSRLFGDDLRVKQVFNNLLSNAFKYTDEGTVTFSLSCEREGNSTWLIARVSDTGIGIMPEQMSKLFNDFSQIDAKSTRTIEGTGLGLSLTKQLAELMDGTIEAKSTYGEGSVFTARLRQQHVTEVPLDAEIIERLKNAQYSGSKRDRSAKLVRASIPYARVLVVDDVDANLDVAKGLMKPYGIQVDTVKSGQSAVELVRKEKPKYNAIFMDHMMPGMDGIEAVRIIREEIPSSYARTIPIIALTANAIAGNEELFLNSGFQAFLAKPIDIIKLDAAINQFVRDRLYERELAAQQDLARAAELLAAQEGGQQSERRSVADRREAERRASERRLEERRTGFDRRKTAGIDLTAGINRFGGDAETYWEIVTSYVANTPKLLDTLDACLQAGDLAGYAVAVHGIKGSSRAVAAEEVGSLAEELEHAAKAADKELVCKLHDFFARQVHAVLYNFGQMLKENAQAASAAEGSGANRQEKPQLERPDTAILQALLAAAKEFDIDGVDTALQELDAFEYTADGGLVPWLHEQMSSMGFKKIVERLNAELRMPQATANDLDATS